MYEREIEMISDVVLASKNYPYVKEAWQTLTAHCTQPTDVQQLKAEIAAVIPIIQHCTACPDNGDNIASAVIKLRQLSV
jgi:hypothetical protein